MKTWIEKENLLDLICWAREQKHITYDGAQILYENIENLNAIQAEDPNEKK